MITNADNLPGVARPRLAELIASLSLAIDLEVGQPLEHVMRAAPVAVRLGESQGLGEADWPTSTHLALLAYVGCTAEAHVIAEATGNDISNNAMVLPVLHGASTESWESSSATRTRLSRARPGAFDCTRDGDDGAAIEGGDGGAL